MRNFCCHGITDGKQQFIIPVHFANKDKLFGKCNENENVLFEKCNLFLKNPQKTITNNNLCQ